MENVRNIMCVIAYDGSQFCGFATQDSKNHNLDSKKLQNIESNLPSIQDFITNTLKKIGINTHIIAAGRTDKDVHATFQVINFYAYYNPKKKAKNLQISQLKPHKMPLEKMQKLLNEKLYPHIKIRKIYEVPPTFHARFCAKSRTYTYIFTKENLLPFYTNYIAKVKFGEIKKIKEALNAFVGVHDFSLFKKNGSETKDNIREIFSAKILTKKVYNLPCHIIQIRANGFLRSQVRMMLFAAFAYSLGKISLQNLQKQIDNKMDVNDRICVRELAPACGLYLSKVEY
ncbi:tRNA pseudouridine(38-40) synthase TruA [Helicobacter saguini]|uniref:tRNA pseudouridine synthase A n=1 Tax=Helicobacter saguini TaxID=1548018 RepID=A0A347VSW2_9HELI|nr:tRNA pseudouridine(38-40) synthase TruA [Helicobacter saguini]MWV62340.1 tRNA pseudouridine(38-40) synthase TruA [Helicobacter saguini]MWV66989.1 tRNA pseudouridine(38-40) synthase TruA [Helicobacter saguini]MWV69337.1 tRNA pseudouridine(38-40) synthase TruA [Helicobacter saguini]MWV71108.1 tRNA pseudouridine(38-40) synthase TruA [Helicobacter saguini]TLD94996.1 tRNA pseudouridine(38-40) synthase TruA [Helicobacter saguini]